jgi:hypothetical protein
MTPLLLIVVIVMGWFVLSAVICVAICVLSSRFTAREEGRATLDPRPLQLWGAPQRQDGGARPEHAKSL